MLISSVSSRSSIEIDSLSASASRIHPFAYAVNTFLQPALDDCRKLLTTNPHETYNLLLSLSQTFTRFAPDADLIYDDIQDFACRIHSHSHSRSISPLGQLKEALEQCVPWLDQETRRQSSILMETARKSLVKIIQQTSRTMKSRSIDLPLRL